MACMEQKRVKMDFLGASSNSHAKRLSIAVEFFKENVILKYVPRCLLAGCWRYSQ